MKFCSNYYTEKRSPRRFAEEVANIVESEFDTKLARRPFNRFKPIETSWWLVPSSKMPFYSFGKYYFTWDEKTMDYIDAGFYIEKGLDASLKVLYPKVSSKGRQLLMMKPWAWDNLMTQIADGTFAELITNSCKKANFSKIYLKVTGNYVDELSLFDPYAPKVKDDYFIFEYDVTTTKVKVIEAYRGNLLLKKFNKATNISNFCKIMHEFNNEHFMWFKFFIFQRFTLEKTTSPPIIRVDSSEFSSNFLNYFKEFIK